ncbi:MAG: hypothetical protein M1818_008164 [Claussenomyces sp. TS43310]|nr:MAG: hypothetical protein M1818_008164 [Claussenomyces sp. TS43310]
MASQSDIVAGAPEGFVDFALKPTATPDMTPETKAEPGPESSESPVRQRSKQDAATSGPTVPAPGSAHGSRLPSLRTVSDPPSRAPMSASSTPLGMLNNARRPAAAPSLSNARAGGGLSQDMLARMKAFHASRPPRPQLSNVASTGQTPDSTGGLSGGLRLPPTLRPQAQGFSSAPAVPRMGGNPGGGLSARRGMKLPGGLPGASSAKPPVDGVPPQNTQGSNPAAAENGNGGSMFNKFSEIVDTKNGTLRFAGKAIIHGQGIDFSTGSNFSISLDEVDTLEELGKGNYGTVYKVRHARPRVRRPGLGLAGSKSTTSPITPASESDSTGTSPVSKGAGATTGVIMAMKELRLELDEAKFAAIIMELDILHRCVSPYIIDFYGAFFQEGAVYICIEFMDGGSIDKIYGDGIPENVLRKITYATTRGLKELKDVHNIIHRDVKPTNILVNTRGQVKICDFGVSGNLVASIAKTNIGCQSYMAPERISGGGVASAGANPGGGTYSVQSDIWSLGLSIIECAMGRYPYPPETYNNIFSQLSAIVDGDPPDLPEEGYSDLARDFVHGCLNKIPKLRPTYTMLLAHPWLADLFKPASISEEDEDLAEDVANLKLGTQSSIRPGIGGEHVYDQEVAEWCQAAMERKRLGLMGTAAKPALHAAPLDSVSPAASPVAVT